MRSTIEETESRGRSGQNARYEAAANYFKPPITSRHPWLVSISELAILTFIEFHIRYRVETMQYLLNSAFRQANTRLTGVLRALDRSSYAILVRIFTSEIVI